MKSKKLIISTCVVVSALALTASRLVAQTNSGDSVIIQSAEAVMVSGNAPGGSQVITLGAGTNGIDVGAISKAIQDGLQQAFGSGGSNLSLGGPGGIFGGNGSFDPAKIMEHFQQRMMDGIREQMGFADDIEWAAVKPLVQRVLDAQQEVAGMGRKLRSGSLGLGGGKNSFAKGFGNLLGEQDCPEEEALQKAIDENAPAAQIRDLIGKYRAWQKGQAAKLEAAQTELRKVLTAKQEAQAMLLGLLD